MFAAPVFVSLVICLLVRDNQGFEDRFFVKGWKERAGTVSPKNCLSASPENYPSECILGKENARPTFVIWGDSFADTMVQTINEYAKAQGKSGLALIKHSCPSVSGTVRNEPGAHLGANFSSECEAYTDSTFEYLQKNSSIETVILNSAYNWYLHASTEAGEPMLTTRDTGEGHDKIARALADTANKLVISGKKVIIIMPHFSLNNPRAAIVRYDTLDDTDSLTMSMEESNTPHEKLDSLLDQYGLDKAVQRIYPRDYLCEDDEYCKFIDESGNLLVSDGHHLSKIAAEKVVSGFSNLF